MVARLDAHQHFWTWNADDYHWMGDNRILQQDYLPRYVEPSLIEHGLHGVVAIQARRSPDETNFLLGLKNEFPFVRAVVGWTDLNATNLPETLDRYIGEVAGFRHPLEEEPDPGYMLSDSFLRGIEALGQKGFTYDLLIRPVHLENTLSLVDRFPNQRFVIDHLAKPDYLEGFETWRGPFEELARRPNVFCKLSGMVTEVPMAQIDEEALSIDPFASFIDVALEAFTPARLMFGSDWPVCTLAATFEEVHDVLHACIDKLSTGEMAAIMGETAAAFYDIHID